MTITEIHVGAEASGVAVAPIAAPAAVTRLLDNDHKGIGRGYIGASLLFLMLATVLGVVVGAERLDPLALDVFDDGDTANQVWTLLHFGLVFLGVVPLLLGLATLVVPLQIGAPSIAFPRAAAVAFWGWLIGSVMFVLSFVIDGGLGGGTTIESDAVALTLVSLALVLVCLVLGAICVITTVVALRPIGMTLADVPFFAWSAMVGAIVWAVTLPALLANLVTAYVDLRSAGQVGPGQFASIPFDTQWVLHQPQIYAFAVPILGIIADVFATSAKVRQAHRGVILGSIAAFGLLGFGAYAQADISDRALYVGMGVVAILPLLVFFGGVADTLRRGASNVGLPASTLIGAILALLLLLGGALIGVLRVIRGLELVGTSADDGHLYAVVLAALVGAGAGLVHWGAKITGGVWREGLARLAMLVLGLGVLLVAVPDVVSGFLDQGNGPFLAGSIDDGVEALNGVAFAGWIVLALGLVALIGTGALSLLERTDAPADPWGGQTLEWATPSPPPVGNFVDPVPSVSSATPLLDAALSDQEA